MTDDPKVLLALSGRELERRVMACELAQLRNQLANAQAQIEALHELYAAQLASYRARLAKHERNQKERARTQARKRRLKTQGWKRAPSSPAPMIEGTRHRPRHIKKMSHANMRRLHTRLHKAA